MASLYNPYQLFISMRKTILLIIFFSTFNLQGQDIPDWGKKKAGSNNSIEGYEVIGSSFPMPDNGVERHLMAIYTALEKYAHAVDSVKNEYAYESTQGKKSNAIYHRHGKCPVDFTILQIFVDSSGREYVILRVTPGKHIFEFYITGIGEFLNEDMSDYEGKEECYYKFSAFDCPLYYEIKETKGISSLSYAIGNYSESLDFEKSHFKKVTKELLQEIKNNY